MTTSMREIEITDSRAVETAGQLHDAIAAFADGHFSDLDKTYVVECVAERLSDGSSTYCIRVRQA